VTITRASRTGSRALVAVLAVATFAFLEPGASHGAAPPPVTGTVELEGYVRAVTGDTLDARLSTRRVGIGVAGIRAPLVNTVCGKEAMAFLQELVNDGAKIEPESGVTPDKYRLVYRVSTMDGRSVAGEMVAAGLAWTNGQGTNRDQLADLEAAARDAKRGCLWQGAGRP